MMTIEERLLRLETANRRWRLALVALGALVFACEGVKSYFELVRVKELVIVDGNDRPVATLIGRSAGFEFNVVERSGSPKLVIDQRGLVTGR